MAEVNSKRHFKVRHRGRGSQMWIYLGKLLRMFVYQSDWKMLPMSALIAGLVGMVIRKRFLQSMEGTLMGCFAIVCVCIWNGCFNSIQVICRERDVIKREHRSGMHISSYIAAHVVYQALVCLAQTGITLYVMKMTGVNYPETSLFTPWFAVDLGITMFLIIFASDMLSLWVSALVRNTTTAMTIMPFVLIFQLVFSGGMLTLPPWTEHLTGFTISNPGLKAVAAQADLNNRKIEMVSTLLERVKNNEISTEISLGEVLDLLTDEENPSIADLRAMEVGKVFTLGELWDALEKSQGYEDVTTSTAPEELCIGDVLRYIDEAEEMKILREYKPPHTIVPIGRLVKAILEDEGSKAILDTKLSSLTTVGDLMEALDIEGAVEANRDLEIDTRTTVGEIVDWVSSLKLVQANRDISVPVNVSVDGILNLVGEERVIEYINDKAAAGSYNAAYEYSRDNIIGYWIHLLIFILVFALLACITLEFIDKDKR